MQVSHPTLAESIAAGAARPIIGNAPIPVPQPQPVDLPDDHAPLPVGQLRLRRTYTGIPPRPAGSIIETYNEHGQLFTLASYGRELIFAAIEKLYTEGRGDDNTGQRIKSLERELAATRELLALAESERAAALAWADGLDQQLREFTAVDAPANAVLGDAPATPAEQPQREQQTPSRIRERQ